MAVPDDLHAHATSPELVDRAFVAAPRSGFLPRTQIPHASQDVPLEIGYGQTSSQPSTVRYMLRLLDVGPGMRVLDVGAGSGWTTALLAHLVGVGGDVIGVELEHDLALWAAANVKANLARGGKSWPARVEQAVAGVLGWPAEAPYDRILVSAQARELPQSLVDQLVAGGVMVCPVGGRMARAVRSDRGTTDVHWSGYFRFVPLRHAAPRQEP